MAGNEVSLGDVVRRLDGLIAETQVRNGNAAGLLGVILEVCLDVLIGMVTDDLDGVLVCTDRTVAAETPELAADGAFGSGIRRVLFVEREMGHVIDDTDGEAVLRFIGFEVFEGSKDACRRRILRTETVAAANNLSGDAMGCESGNNVEVKRFALRAGFLGSVENGNLLNSLRNGFDELFSNKRSVKTNLDKADLFAVCVHVIDNFFGNVADRAHCDDDSVGIGCAVVVEELIVGAELGIDLVHVFFHDSRQCVIVLVAGFSVLEEDIAVFSGTAKNRRFRIEGTFSERLDSVHIDHFLKICIVPNFDLLDFVRRTEAIEEVDKRNTTLNGGKVSHSREIHDFLRVGLGKHCITGLTAGIDVGMVAEDVQSVRSDAASRNVDNVRKQFAGDLVHIRDHQKKTLGSGVGSGKSTGSKRTVNSTGSAALRFHFHDLNTFAEDISCRFAKDVLICCGPGIRYFCHRAGRRNRINGRNLREGIGNVRRGGVAVHR